MNSLFNNPAFDDSINETSIVTNGLVFRVDSGDRNSYYPQQANWKDLVNQSNSVISYYNSPVVYNATNGGCIQFDGVNTLVTTDFHPSSSLGQQFTIEAWAYPTTGSNYKGMAGCHGDLGVNGIVFGQYENGGWDFAYGSTTGQWRTNVVTLPLNTWLHMTAVYDCGNTITVYKNGVLLNQTATANTILHSPSFYIGVCLNGGGRHFGGLIPQLSVYNRLLSVAEIQKNFNATKCRYL